MKKILLYFLVITMFVGFYSQNLLGTSVPQLSLEGLLDKSALVFRGSVLQVDRQFFDSVTNTPFTKVVFAVNEVIGGEWSDPTIEFMVPGGIYPDGSFLEHVGSPQFLEGKKYLVFIRAGKWHITPVTNWWHSVFTEVEVDGKTVLMSQSGRVVTELNAKGFVLGKKIASPAMDEVMRAIRGDSVFQSNKTEKVELVLETDNYLEIEDTTSAIKTLFEKRSNQSREVFTQPKGFGKDSNNTVTSKE